MRVVRVEAIRTRLIGIDSVNPRLAAGGGGEAAVAAQSRRP
jgi:hypothetical protein